MFKRFAALAAVAVVCILAMGQNNPAAWTVGKSYQGGTAKWSILDKTVPVVWDAMMQIAFTMKKTKATGDKPSGIVKISQPGARVQVLISQTDAGVNIIAQWEFEGGEKIQLRSPFKQATIFFDAYFPKVAEILK